MIISPDGIAPSDKIVKLTVIMIENVSTHPRSFSLGLFLGSRDNTHGTVLYSYFGSVIEKLRFSADATNCSVEDRRVNIRYRVRCASSYAGRNSYPQHERFQFPILHAEERKDHLFPNFHRSESESNPRKPK